MVLKNVFSWSKSRNEEFQECQREYYYDRYASWGGWDAHAPQEARQAYILKNLKNRWAWKGETVHHVVEDVLKSIRSGSPISQDVALKQLTETMRINFRSSESKLYLKSPKNNLGLFEHEYEKPVTGEVWKKIHDESIRCLQNFYQSDFFKVWP